MEAPSVRQPANERVIRYLERTRVAEEDRAPRPGHRDYWEAGSHPDVVERIWDQLGRDLPPDSKRVVCGTPVLLHPRSKVLLAVAIGTQYAIRLPAAVLRSGLPAGARTETVWAGGTRMNVQQELGDDWIFGSHSPVEVEWCEESFRERPAIEPAGTKEGAS
jgi:hypothetical protein